MEDIGTNSKNKKPLIKVGSVETIRWPNILISVICILILCAISFYIGHKWPVNISSKPGTIIKSPPTTTFNYSGWQTYNLTSDGIIFKYPDTVHVLLSGILISCKGGGSGKGGCYQTPSDIYFADKSEKSINNLTNYFTYTTYSKSTAQNYVKDYETMFEDSGYTLSDEKTVSINNRSFYTGSMKLQSNPASTFYIFLDKDSNLSAFVFYGTLINESTQVLSSISY